MHGQSYGYNAYFEGDTVAFVKASTMERFASAQVVAVKRLTDRIVQVTFNRDIPGELELNHDCVENIKLHARSGNSTRLFYEDKYAGYLNDYSPKK